MFVEVLENHGCWIAEQFLDTAFLEVVVIISKVVLNFLSLLDTFHQKQL